MMISPEMYFKEIKSYSKEELAKERERLEQYIENYNNNSLEKDVMKPSPSTVVSVYKDYLKEIDKLEKK